MTGDPATFMSLFGASGYMTTIKVCELLFGIMVLIPKTRALGLLLLAPIVVNILLFELHIAHAPGIGVALTAVTAIDIYFDKEKYSSILAYTQITHYKFDLNNILFHIYFQPSVNLSR